MSVVPDALDKILWRDMFSLEVSVVGETEHPTKLLVKKRQGEILCSVYSRLMVHLGRKPIPDHKKCSGPNFKAHVNIWWEFPLHALAQRWFRNVHVATLLKSFPSNIYIYQDHPKGLIYDQMMLMPHDRTFNVFASFVAEVHQAFGRCTSENICRAETNVAFEACILQKNVNINDSNVDVDVMTFLPTHLVEFYGKLVGKYTARR